MCFEAIRKVLGRDIRSVFSPWIEDADALPRFKELEISGCAIRGAGLFGLSLVRDLYLFYSAADAICFASIYPQTVSHFGNTVFVSTGNVPEKRLIASLHNVFHGVKLHTVFDKDLSGRIADCKIALWWTAKDSPFSYDAGSISGFYRGKKVVIPEELFSLNQFKLRTGFKCEIRTHKAPSGYASYLDLVRHNFQG